MPINVQIVNMPPPDFHLTWARNVVMDQLDFFGHYQGKTISLGSISAALSTYDMNVSVDWKELEQAFSKLDNRSP